MKIQKLLQFDLSETFNLKSVATVEELMNHDMIYIYHHLKPGIEVDLIADGSNVKGDIRYRVVYKNFKLGFVTLGGFFRSYYENNPVISATVSSLMKDRYMPLRQLDLEIDLVRLKNVS